MVRENIGVGEGTRAVVALTMKCDRCGTQIPEKEQNTSARVRVIAGGNQLAKMDLCERDQEELLKQLDKFLHH